MTRFRLITEGVTDQAVIENILYGCCGEDISIAELQPLRDQKDSFGNWIAVFSYCASSKFEEAFQFTDYIVIHIDTDRCEDKNFDVPRQEEGVTLSPRQLIERVELKLREKIGQKVWEAFGERIIFAIAVDSIECWLLPLYAKAPHNAKYQNCLDTLNRERAKQKFARPLGKRYRDYQEASRKYSKPRTLKECCQVNDGLQTFIENLQRRDLDRFDEEVPDAEVKTGEGDETATA